MNEDHEVTQQITDALELRPQIAAPADFTARFMAHLPHEAPRRTLPAMPRPSHYGRLAMQAMLALVMLGMLLVAIFFGRSGTWAVVQEILFLQFGTLTLFMVLAWRRVL